MKTDIQKGSTILLVDNDIAHRTMLKVNLKQEGYILKEVADGDEVLPFLSHHDY
jgi:two-component system response regulator HydG